ncbi:hypothetical protein ACFL3G_05200 [Planctomycetota bacterium]
MRTKERCIVGVVVVLIMLVVLCGCEQSKTSQCEQDKLQLQKTIESQQAKIEEMKKVEEMLSDLLRGITDELERTQEELAKTKTVESPRPRPRKPGKITPEQSERLIKGIEELKALKEAKIKQMKERSGE